MLHNNIFCVKKMVSSRLPSCNSSSRRVEQSIYTLLLVMLAFAGVVLTIGELESVQGHMLDCWSYEVGFAEAISTSVCLRKKPRADEGLSSYPETYSLTSVNIIVHY